MEEGTLAAACQKKAPPAGGLRDVLSIVRAITLLLLFAFAASGPAAAQNAVRARSNLPANSPATSPMSDRLSAEKLSDVEAGIYSVSDKLNFTLAPYGDKYLLRFTGNPENYVLSVQRVILGGRILRYDTGAIAIRVSVWGGMTMYTADAPGGLPATKIGDETAPPPPAVSRNDLAAAMVDEGNHLAYSGKLRLRFVVDPAVLSGSEEDRRLAFDALVSAEAGVERLLSNPGGRDALKRFTTVRLVRGEKPSVTASGKIVTVSFAPASGVEGRASSREVAMELGKLLQVAEEG